MAGDGQYASRGADDKAEWRESSDRTIMLLPHKRCALFYLPGNGICGSQPVLVRRSSRGIPGAGQGQREIVRWKLMFVRRAPNLLATTGNGQDHLSIESRTTV
jgi:hypothetical protein